MFRFVIFVLFLIEVSVIQHVRSQNLTSPNGNLSLMFWLNNDSPQYSVKHKETTLIDSSSMGFKFKNSSNYYKNVLCFGFENKYVDEMWKPVWGTDSIIRNNYNSVVFHLADLNEPDRKLDIEFRAYNDGVAFRYVFPEKLKDSLFIIEENTEFKFAHNDSVWWIPEDEFAYESLYRHTLLSDAEKANTPFTVVAPKYSIVIHEAALIDYSEMYLAKKPGDSLTFCSQLWSWPDGIGVRAMAPFKTPWRVIMVSENPAGLIQSHIIQNLNEPCAIKNTSWIKPMKFAGIWWGMHTGNYTWYYGPKHGATTERAKQYIDFYSGHNIGGLLAEGWNKGWETWATDTVAQQDFCKPYPDFDLKQVVRYAKKKNVELISHHETGGNIPMYEKQMKSAMKLCRRLGIHSLKTGYAGPIIPAGMHHHGQYMVRHFQKVVEMAAHYKITINAHESIKPTGLDRTWPNLMSQECARGNEWNATYNAIPPYHATILPFTRFLAGPFDYTPGIFKINHDSIKNKRLYCTLAGELSLYVIFHSPLMMVADLPENYENKPAFKFIEDVPCTWDETKVIEAQPGKLICIARRKGKNWFIGARTNENSSLFEIPFSFLAPDFQYNATIYSDAINTDWQTNPEEIEIGNYLLTNKDTLLAALSKAGGLTISITPIDFESKDKTIKNINSFNASTHAKAYAFSKQNTFGNLTVNNKAIGAKVNYLIPISSKYPASGDSTLCDGKIGQFNIFENKWQGFEGTGFDILMELPELVYADTFIVRFLYSPNDWIFLPDKVEFLISTDNKEFASIAEIKIDNEKETDLKIMDIKKIEIVYDSLPVRYLRIKATSSGVCPQWHYASGKKSWIFIDEIILK